VRGGLTGENVHKRLQDETDVNCHQARSVPFSRGAGSGRPPLARHCRL